MNYDKLFNALANESSSNKKLEILRAYENDELLKRIITMTLDPNIRYWIIKIPEYSNTFGTMSLEDALDSLMSLADRTYTGNAGIDWLQNILNHTLTEDAEVVKRIIGRDLRCGVSTAIVNKIWPKLIDEYPVMLCSTYSEKLVNKIKFPAMVQKKEDGMRVNPTVIDGTVQIFSRSGKLIPLHGYLDDEFLIMADNHNLVYDGELLVRNENGIGFCDRKKGNGIINKAIKGTISKKDAARVVAVLWDRIPFEDFENRCCDMVYRARFTHLLYDVTSLPNSDKIVTVESRVVETIDEVNDIFANYLASGSEGIILKDMDTKWEFKRSTQQIKFKGVEDCSLRCISVEEGKGKYTGFIGGLYCESEDGLLSVTVGTGLSDEQRKLDPEVYIDQIIDIKYNVRIGNKKGGLSLFSSVFVEVRTDKDVADTIDHIK